MYYRSGIQKYGRVMSILFFVGGVVIALLEPEYLMFTIIGIVMLGASLANTTCVAFKYWIYENGVSKNTLLDLKYKLNVLPDDLLSKLRVGVYAEEQFGLSWNEETDFTTRYEEATRKYLELTGEPLITVNTIHS